MKEVWVVYKPHYSGQRDDFMTFTNIAIFQEEIDALRHATKNGCKAVLVSFGKTLDETLRAVERGIPR